MSEANVFVKVGTTLARVHPENAEATRLLLERASKIRSAKQFRAAINAQKCGRTYPRFTPGMSTAAYVKAYEAQNVMRNLSGHYTAAECFFEPLSTAPQYAQSGEVIEEIEL